MTNRPPAAVFPEEDHIRGALTRSSPGSRVRSSRLFGRPRNASPGRRTRPRPPSRRGPIFIKPWVPFEVGVLHKQNIVARDWEGYEGFNHLVVRIRHPGRYDANRPEVILIPGILCNGNLFRLSWGGKSFKDLNHPLSFANALAFAGYSVVLVHPRDSRWIYSRYVNDVLGVPNTFSDDFSIADAVDDICFHIDTVTKIREQEHAPPRVVVLGFSLGGIKLLDMLGSRPLHPAIAGLAFLSTPVEFDTNGERLIPLVRIYSQAARLMPVEHYGALNLIDRNVIVAKRVARRLLGDTSPRVAGRLLRRVPLISDVFHVSDPSFDLSILLPLVSYVLEPVSATIMKELLYAVRKGRLVKRDAEDDCLDLLPETVPPWVVIRGSEDRIVTPRSHDMLDGALTCRQKSGYTATIAGLGHDDLVVSRAVLREVLYFLEGLPVS